MRVRSSSRTSRHFPAMFAFKRFYRKERKEIPRKTQRKTRRLGNSRDLGVTVVARI